VAGGTREMYLGLRMALVPVGAQSSGMLSREERTCS
jgi:hypothetical protein